MEVKEFTAGASFDEAAEHLQPIAEELFDRDPRVRSVGISRFEDGYGIRAVRNSALPVPLSANFGDAPNRISNIPIIFKDTFGEVESLVLVPGIGPGSPSATTTVPEVLRHRPLVCGLQIQNFDDDVRKGHHDNGFITIGTLGCFVALSSGRPGILSNNHVIAGENAGVKGSDRILQPGSISFSIADQIATLHDFETLVTSIPGNTPTRGGVHYNLIDAAVGELADGVQFVQGYLPFRKLLPPSGIAAARLGDKVYKVGRTTGLTFGEVIDIGAIVGPVPYDPGPCWFRRSITIEGDNGSTFSDKGDSGSVIVRTNGEVIGILYAGNGQQTYACPIDEVLGALHCTLI